VGGVQQIALRVRGEGQYSAQEVEAERRRPNEGKAKRRRPQEEKGVGDLKMDGAHGPEMLYR
jgi:hypothetical protein